MFKKIANRIKYPDWVDCCPRYCRLDALDRLLDGTFYDHLPFAFYDEKTGNQNTPVKLEDKRPSAQYHLPRMVARWCARKMFSGRHSPRIWHDDKEKRIKVKAIANGARLYEKMTEIATLGSIGSVAATFRIGDDGKTIGIDVWHSKHCWPKFKPDGELDSLRVCYITDGWNLINKGITVPEPEKDYWFIRDYTENFEIIYVPPLKDDWDPVRGFRHDTTRALIPIAEMLQTHELGFVPAHWFMNLSGGVDMDGACTWEDAIPNSIEIDYTLSQIGRGTRYNCSPQVVIKGDVTNPSEEVARGPLHYIHLAPDRKDQDGNVMGGADAFLLEMTGESTRAALELVHVLRNTALEQISATRKDPEKIKGTLSGRAMEFMEEDSDDLAMELRCQYGEHGLLPFLKKILKAMGQDVEGYQLHWPRLSQPTPDEISVLIPALAIAIDPLAQAQSRQPGNDQKPAQASVKPDEEYMLLTPQEARSYLKTMMDIAMLDDDDEELGEDTGSGNNNVPPPKLDDDGTIKPEDRFGMKIGAPVKV